MLFSSFGVGDRCPGGTHPGNTNDIRVATAAAKPESHHFQFVIDFAEPPVLDTRR